MMETWGARLRASRRRPRPRPGGRSSSRTRTLPAASASPSARPSRRRSPILRGRPATRSGSVLNHVMLHQTIIGLEAKKQLKLAGVDRPDVVIGCAGGGSNFAGLSFPVRRRQDPRRRHRDHPGRARGVPDPDPRAVRLRPRRHRPHDAAAADALARTRVHPAVDPRRRPALPRDGPAGQRRRASTDCSPRAPRHSSSATRRPCCSRGPRASSRRRKRATPSPPRSTRRSRRRRRAGEGHPVQLQRARPDGHGRLSGVLRGPARELPAAARGAGALARSPERPPDAARSGPGPAPRALTPHGDRPTVSPFYEIMGGGRASQLSGHGRTT